MHTDLIDGLSSKDIVVDYLAQKTETNGIISTKSNLIKQAKNLGLYTIQHFFILDSFSIQNIDKQLVKENIDLIEIIPGLMPKIIRQIAEHTGVPVIAGGLIREKEDIINALNAGAVAVSTTQERLWFE